MPDYADLAKELVRPGVTMQLLWEEYVDECRRNEKIYYQLTQFKKYFNDHLNTQSFSHTIHHKAGETAQVDWAGTKIQWIDPDTGKIIRGSLFVACLPFSGYAFAVGCYDEKMPNWIDSHVQMLQYFGGVPTILVPDNLKTGVTKNTRSELLLNPTYEDFANHYHTIVVPTRTYRPRDKAYVENNVRNLTTHIIARMRNYQCFSLDEYNEYLRQELDRFNRKPFQKKVGNRLELFKTYEQPVLQELPRFPYEMCEYREAKVYSNSHISLKKHYYSVPYQFIGEKVTLKIYNERVEIFRDGKKIAQHLTQYKSPH